MQATPDAREKCRHAIQSLPNAPPRVIVRHLSCGMWTRFSSIGQSIGFRNRRFRVRFPGVGRWLSPNWPGARL
jgi:hypothetical protein